jgi:hypothetical protein
MVEGQMQVYVAVQDAWNVAVCQVLKQCSSGVAREFTSLGIASWRP